ncbi:hypothetical protein GNF81_20750, partial [Clostridium perfringens]|nr:hypothetical protein [Clostridium perfringens]
MTFNGVGARYIRITAKDSWGSQYWGLSEVVFIEADGGEIETVENINAETVIGQYPQLPIFANVAYKNQSQGMKAVKWDSIDPSILNKEGEYSISGKIIDTEVNVTCTLKVNKMESTVNKKNLSRLINIVIGKEEIAYST